MRPAHQLACVGLHGAYVARMSVEEIKRTVEGASGDERRFMAAYLKLKTREGDPQIAHELANAQRRIEAGRYATYEDLMALVEAPLRGGR